MAELLDIALKEWAAVCSALADGRQVILLRKGGIHDAGGRFELEYPRFLLFPTYLHQNPDMLKPAERGRYAPVSAEPDRIELAALGEVTDILRLGDRRQMDVLEDEHVWTPPLIDMRYSYRPENPLYLMLVRVARLPNSVTIDNAPTYAGCRSWVPLDRGIDPSGAVPVLGEDAYKSRRERIMERLARAG